MDYPFFEVEKIADDRIAFLYLNRPDKRNAMNWDFWYDLPKIVRGLEADEDVRVVILAARGKSFSTGLDLEEFDSRFGEYIGAESADEREELLKFIDTLQLGMNAVAKSDLIFIAAVHRHCIGGGLDLISACDLRVASKDATFSLREAKLAIVADMGSINRLPAIIGDGHTRLMALTGRDFKAEEVYRMGLLSEVYESQEAMMDGALALAREIAANPSIAVRGTKRIMNYGLNHGQDDSLAQVVLWNTAFINSRDLREALDAMKNRRRPNFR